jgi:hypothetical protein
MTAFYTMLASRLAMVMAAAALDYADRDMHVSRRTRERSTGDGWRR